jgi:ribosomal protein S18 acetylase RimI-like enzyme
MFARLTDRHEFEPVEANLRETLKFFALANDRGKVVETNDLLLISSGINYGVFNTVLLKERVESEARLLELIARAENFFGERGERWSFWCCQDLLVPPVLRRLRRLMEARHLRLLSEPPGMTASFLLPPRRELPELEVRPVATEFERQAFAGILSTTFDLPYSICSEIYSVERSWQGGYRGWVGLVKGEPVVSTACVVAAGVLGIYSVGTMPNWRRRGYAEQLMRIVLDEVSRETSIERTILQSTSEGFHVYQKMGYRRVTQFSIFLIEP